MLGEPHPNPPSVPRPAAGSAAERAEASLSAKPGKPRRMCARLWFAQGFWWFRSAKDGSIWEISSVMRELRYDARELARALGFTERSFERLVKDEVGPSVGQWLRLLRAAELRFRVKTGEPLLKLAEDFGFKHQTDFTVEFKRWYKVSPRDYLKDFQKANSGPEKSRKRKIH